MARNIAKFKFWVSLCSVVVGVGGFWGLVGESTCWAESGPIPEKRERDETSASSSSVGDDHTNKRIRTAFTEDNTSHLQDAMVEVSQSELAQGSEIVSSLSILERLPDDLMGYLARFLSQGEALTRLKPTCRCITGLLKKPNVRKIARPPSAMVGRYRWPKLKKYTDFGNCITGTIDRQFVLEFENLEDFKAFLNDFRAQDWVTGLSIELKFPVTDLPVGFWKKLGMFKNLTNLIFGGPHKLGPEGMEFLSSALLELKGITRLGLSYHNIGEQGIKAFVPVLERLGALEWLSFHGNNIGPEGMKALAPALSKLGSLEALDFANNTLGEQGIKAFAPVLQKLRSLVWLSIGENNIDPEGMKLLAPALSKLGSLVALDLEMNTLGETGAKLLAPILSKLGALVWLSFHGNKIGLEGVKVLAPELSKLGSLEKLGLSGNQLDNEGVRCLALEVAKLKNLKELYLGTNALRWNGVEALINALKTQHQLEVLTLDNNYLQEHGVLEVLSALSHLKSLRRVNLRNNHLEAATRRDILEDTKKNWPNLQVEL